MRFVYDHDLHIHTNISPCASDPEQTPSRLLKYAEDNGLSTICVTDHYWDETVGSVASLQWYLRQNTLPYLPNFIRRMRSMTFLWKFAQAR